MNRIFFILLILISVPAQACVVPNMGDEFDKLVSVEKIGTNKFKAVIPNNVEGLIYGASATVEYYPSNSKYRFGEYSKRVTLFEKGSSYISKFELVKIEGFIPFLQVYWYPEKHGLCGAYGKSKNLVVE